uniref:Uncharacterized protein n=1 Tax=Oryza nivara TaxID=4536 RepID=A0A0E0J4L7_ORYNI
PPAPPPSPAPRRRIRSNKGSESSRSPSPAASDGPLQRVELPPQELRARLPRLPGLREPSWADQEVWAHVLQAVLPQQRQGYWLHQVPLKAILPRPPEPEKWIF